MPCRLSIKFVFRFSPFSSVSAFRFMIRSFPFLSVSLQSWFLYTVLLFLNLSCFQLQSNLNLVLDYSHRVVLKLFLIIWFVFLCPNIFLRRYQFLLDLFAVLLRSGAVRRWCTTGRGYMQAGFPNIIRKTLSVKTYCPMKRTWMILSCLHIAAVGRWAIWSFACVSLCLLYVRNEGRLLSRMFFV